MIVNGQAVVRHERRNDMELYEIMMKLVGPVQPADEHEEGDRKRRLTQKWVSKERELKFSLSHS